MENGGGRWRGDEVPGVGRKKDEKRGLRVRIVYSKVKPTATLLIGFSHGVGGVCAV